MIPWIREKFAERRARFAARSKRNENSEETNGQSSQQPQVELDANAEERLQGSSVNGRRQNGTTPMDRINCHPGNGNGTDSNNSRRGANVNERRHHQQHHNPHHHHNQQQRRNTSAQQLRFYTPELLRRLRPTAATSRSLRSLRSNIETSNIVVGNESDDNHTLRQDLTPNSSSQSSIRSSSQATLCSQSPTTIISNNANNTSSTSASHCTLLNSNRTDLNFLKARASNEALENTPGNVEDVQPLTVHVICPSGRVLVFQATSNKTLAELKHEVLLEVAEDRTSLPILSTDIRTLTTKYRLIRAEYAGSDLNENLSLGQLNIVHNDTLVLILKRSFQASNYSPTVASRPNETQINEATKNVQTTTANMPTIDTNEIFQQSNIQFDVRKVLISLAQASAVILGAGPYAERLIETLKQKIINKKNFQNDTLQCLIDMGFTKEHAEYALKLHNGVYASAIEWLLATQNDKDAIDTADKSAMQKSESTISASLLKTSDTDILANTEALLEIVRIYSHRDTPPTQEAIETLKTMGFNEDDIMVALKKTCNNKAAACEWLCGNRSGSLIELRDGLSQDSPILKTILEMHEVQYNLGNPKVFLAFLAILENENLLRIWGGDNDTTTVITSILQKYHEEKHILGLNQFYAPQYS